MHYFAVLVMLVRILQVIQGSLQWDHLRYVYEILHY